VTLSDKISFDDALSRGKKAANNLFLVSYLRKERPPGRVGISVPKRLVGRATERNKIKRVVREAFIRSLRLLPVDVIAVYKDKPAQKRSVKIVRESIQKHFDKIKTELETRESQ
jgi:ribonuclease P protein component